MDQPKLPRIYFLKREAVQSESVRRALRLTPVKGILAIHPDDLKAVSEEPSLDNTSALVTSDGWGPVVIVAEGFDHPLSVLNEDGSLEIVCQKPDAQQS